MLHHCQVESNAFEIENDLTLRRLVFTEQDCKLGEYAHVSTFQAKTRLEKANDFFKVASGLVHGDEGAEFLLHFMRNRVVCASVSIPHEQ